jgi:hypothetical protein
MVEVFNHRRGGAARGDREASGRGASRAWRTGLVATAAAAATNLLLHRLGSAAGVSFAGELRGEPVEIRAVDVLALTVGPMVLGTALAALAARVPRGLRAVQVLGALIAVVSIGADVALEAQAAARVILASMHVVAGAAFVLGLERARTAEATRSP